MQQQVPSEPFWMIYGEGQGAPTVCHHHPKLAQDEAQRLARLNPGVRFFVLQSVGVAQKIDVQYRAIDLDAIPF